MKMSVGRKFVICILIFTTVLCAMFTYRMYFEAKKMWDLGPTSDLYNVPCTVTKVLSNKEVLADTLENVELRVEMGPFDKDVKIGDSIGVVYDKNDKPITSFSRYYQIIQIALVSILITCLIMVVTISFVVLSIMDSRDKENYYLDDDYSDEDFEQYLYDDKAVS